MFLRLLGATGLPVWVTNSFPVIRQIIMVLVAVAALAMIVVTMVQPTEASGSNNVITGSSSESFYSKNRASSREGRFKRLTIALSIFIAVMVIVYCILTAIYAGK